MHVLCILVVQNWLSFIECLENTFQYKLTEDVSLVFQVISLDHTSGVQYKVPATKTSMQMYWNEKSDIAKSMQHGL